MLVSQDMAGDSAYSTRSSAEPHRLKIELNIMGEALRTRDGGIGQWQKALRMLWEAKQRRSWSKVAV